jgi:indolepyruvate ferredoxin oxidoreductase
MNAITLDDKYAATSGRVYVSGGQALVRLPIEQARRDAAAGHNTAGFVSGYRGSPLGTYDSALWQAEKHLAANRIHFEPGVNEDLAATAVWGTQQLPLIGGAKHEGVFGIWYGKGPGVDRSTDVLKHANFAGTSALGGVIALCGDDHAARSSTVAHQSDHALIHCGIPVFNPADIQDYIDLGLMGFALSRFASLWVGMKCITDIVDGSASIAVGEGRVMPVLPDFDMPSGGLSIRKEVAALAQEQRLFEYRLQAAQAFVRANVLDRPVFGPAGRKRLGIVTTGKGVSDVREALDRLGVGAREAEELGVAVFKVAVVWPLEPDAVRAFAAQCDELLVIEEKRAVIEEQLTHILYNLPADRRPRIVGKRDQQGRPLVSELGELDPDAAMMAIAARIDAFTGETTMGERAGEVRALSGISEAKPLALRPASFCAGCPHNTSTVVPEGSIAIAGIGCHGMASLMPERNTMPGTQMGGEGAPWIGQAPFVERKHIFQNLGDGTYFHSGLLAIRACVAANVPITYKILLNGAVGMTGGQPIEGQEFQGEVTAPKVAQQVAAEGVKRVAIVSDEEDRFEGAHDAFPAGTSFHHRDQLDAVQKDLREYPGVSVLIFDQSCATERRRLRKRGKIAESEQRVLIAPDACEGCGDCGVQSNCIAIEPLETEFGRKRQINQSVCNQDFSCLKGFCPSFITVTGATPRARAGSLSGEGDLAAGLSDPVLPSLETPRSLLVTGIGGAGVVTIGAILGMAAHLEGLGASVLDMSGFAQRNGSVMSHVRFTDKPGEHNRSLRIPPGDADVVIGCDPIVTAGPECIRMMKPQEGRVVLNRFVAPTNAFALDPDYRVDLSMLERRIGRRVGAGHIHSLDATKLATALLGNAIGANMMLVGHAWQSGLIPLRLESIEQALRLNGTALRMNLTAFALGRLTAVDPARVEQMLAAAGVHEAKVPETLEAMLASRSRRLAVYQNETLAQRYRAFVTRVAEAEAKVAPGSDALAIAVADTYAKLLVIKDEYEVARMLTGEVVRAQLAETFEGEDVKIRFNLAPPLLSRRDPETGRLAKRSFGAWMTGPMKLLSKMKGLRGTPLDVFGYHAHRRRERALITEYEALVTEILASLTARNHAAAVDLAGIYRMIRGYDVVKDASIDAMAPNLAEARARFDAADDAAESQQVPAAPALAS